MYPRAAGGVQRNDPIEIFDSPKSQGDIKDKTGFATPQAASSASHNSGACTCQYVSRCWCVCCSRFLGSIHRLSSDTITDRVTTVICAHKFVT